jgi:hypothetical protein
MKRLFFVFLFALTALFFSACSSSGGGGGDNPPAPQEISGKVIVPSDGAYDIYVCSDTNGNNSCKDEETVVQATVDTVNNIAAYTITADAGKPLAAEFYLQSPSSGSSISAVTSLPAGAPVIVYTTPAPKFVPSASVNETVISAFTTMVKNKADLDPMNVTVNMAVNDFVSDCGMLINPFKAADYDSSIIAVHNIVTDIVASVLEHIKDTLSSNVVAIAGDSFTQASIAALYNAVYDLVDDIAANPSDLASSYTGGINSTIENDIANAQADIDEANDADVWDLNTPFIIYQIAYNHHDYYMTAFQTGPTWTQYIETLISDLDSGLSGTNNMADQEPNPFTMAQLGIVPENYVKTLPSSISTTARFSSRSIALPGNAAVYTMLATHNYTIPGDNFEFLRANFDSESYVFHCSWHSEVTITSTGSNTYRINDVDSGYITMDETNKSFRWVETGNKGDVFADDFAFNKRGTYTHNNAGTGEETYTFTATDGSVAKVFRPNSDPSRLAMATYPVVSERLVFFNAAAAGDIRDWLNTNHITPAW